MFGRSTYHRITTIVVGLGAFFAPSIAAQSASNSTTTAKHSSGPCATAMSTMADSSKAARDTVASSKSRASAKANCPKRKTSHVAKRTTSTSGGDVNLSNSSGRTYARSSERIPVSKEPEPAPAEPAPTPAPAPAPMPAPPVDTAVTAAPPPPPPDTAVTPPPPPPQLPKMPKYYSRFYYGVSAGPSIPVQSIDNGFNTGYTIDVPIGYEFPFYPLGFRLDLGYTNLGSRDSFRNGNAVVVNGQLVPVSLATNDAQIWSALVNAKLRLPWLGHFGGGLTSGLYAIGGLGVNTLHNYNTTFALTNPEFNDGSISADRKTVTRFALNGGGGIQWGLGLATVFVESRYVTAFTPNNNASYVPIILGVSFH